MDRIDYSQVIKLGICVSAQYHKVCPIFAG